MKIIDGKSYDPETSTTLYDSAEGSSTAQSGHVLYRTRLGNYFVVEWSRFARTVYRPLSEAEMKEWVGQHCPYLYERISGEKPVEA